jgi:hypothetical protein
LLVAELNKTDKDCSGALWARAADRPEPAIFVREAAPPELAQRVQQQVRKLPDYRATDREYQRSRKGKAASADNPPDWENFEDATPELWSFRHGDRQLVSYASSVGGCGSFTAALWALFELRDDKLVMIAQSGSGGVSDELVPISIVDVDLDGLPDVLGGGWNNVAREADTVTRGVSTGLELVRDVAPAFHDCGC